MPINPFGKYPPAFPQEINIPKGTRLITEDGQEHITNEDYRHLFTGVNRLDYFAVHALIGILSHQEVREASDHQIATEAVGIAKAMLEQLSKP